MSENAMSEVSHIDTVLTIAVETTEAALRGERADRMAWALNAWSLWRGEVARHFDDGRRLSAVMDVLLEHKAPGLLHATVWLRFVPGPNANELAENEARRQFWTQVEAAFAVLAGQDAAVAA